MRRTSQAGWSLVALLCIPVFLGSLDLLVVSAFLPDLLRELALPLDASGQEAAAWLVNAYLIAYSIALLAVGRLSDLTGWRTALTLCLGLYFIGSLLVINYPAVAGVLSPLYGLVGIARDPAHASLHAIILARIIAAFGAGALASVALSLVSQVFNTERRALAVGVIAAMDTIGWMFGGFWGGVVIQFSDWRTVFIVNLPLILGTLFLLRRQLRGVEQRRATGRFDAAGFVLAAAALVAINLGIARVNTDAAGGLDASGLWLPLLITAILTAAFAVVEMRLKQPLIRLSLLRRPDVLPAHLINILLGVVLLIVLLLLPIFTNVRETGNLGLLIFFSRFTEQGLRDAALIQGGLIAAFALPLAISSVLGGGMYERLGGRRTILIGLIIAGFGVALFWGSISMTTPYGVIALAAAVAGAGVGIAFTPVIVLLLDAAPDSERGAAAALTLSLRMVAMSVTTSFSTAFITQRTVDLVRAMESPNALLDALPHSQYAASPFASSYIAAVNSAIRELFAASLLLLALALLIGRFIRPPGSRKTLTSQPRRIPTAAPFLLAAALLTGASTPAAAQDTAAPLPAAQTEDSLAYIRAAAAYIPAQVEFFAAARTGADAIAALDAVLTHITSRLALNDPLSVARLIAYLGEYSPMVTRLNLILPFMDSAAVALHRAEGFLDTARFGDQGEALYVVAFSRAMEAVKAAAPLLFSGAQRDAVVGYDLYRFTDDSALIALGEDHLIFAQGETDALQPDQVLGDDDRFRAALAELPRGDYGVFAYGAISEMLPLVHDRLFADLLDSLAFGAQTDMALGLAAEEMPEGLNLFADVVQTAATANPLPVIQPSFARYAPADAAFLVQSASIGALIRTAAALYASISAVETSESALALLEGFSQEVLKLSLEYDLLPTLTSDYLLAVDYHAVDLLNGAAAIYPVEFAIFMEADSAASASRVSESLYGAARLFLQERQDAVFRESDRSVQVGALDVVFGVQDRVAYFGTRAFVQEGLSGRAPLSETDDFHTLTAQALDASHAIAYISRRGIGELLTLSGALDPAQIASETLIFDDLPFDLEALTGIDPARLYQLADGGLLSIAGTPSGARLVRLALALR